MCCEIELFLLCVWYGLEDIVVDDFGLVVFVLVGGGEECFGEVVLFENVIGFFEDGDVGLFDDFWCDGDFLLFGYVF